VGTVERNIQKIKEEFNKVVLSIVDQILEKTMRCVSLQTKIRIRCKWTNNTRVLQDSEIS
jgi:hypothetical protein